MATREELIALLEQADEGTVKYLTVALRQHQHNTQLQLANRQKMDEALDRLAKDRAGVERLLLRSKLEAARVKDYEVRRWHLRFIDANPVARVPVKHEITLDQGNYSDEKLQELMREALVHEYRVPWPGGMDGGKRQTALVQSVHPDLWAKAMERLRKKAAWMAAMDAARCAANPACQRMPKETLLALVERAWDNVVLKAVQEA